MRFQFRCFVWMIALVVLAGMSAVSVSADDMAVAGRKILAAKGSAVVIVQIAVKTTYTFEGQAPMPREEKNEATGTLIDPSGLVVMSLAETSPEGAFGQLMPDEGGRMDVSSEITDLKIILGTGEQIPGKVVLRDKDRDLAFVRPTTKGKVFPYVDLAKSGKPQVLDEIVQLDRIGLIGGRKNVAEIGRINAMIEKPRTFYISPFESLGSPVFMSDGRVIGVILLRSMPASAQQSGPPAMPVIMPAQDILGAAKQAPK